MLRNLADAARFMEHEWLASLATVDSEGTPHVIPVWFTYENGSVHVQTARNSVRVRNLKQNDNVALAVYRGEEAVLIWGKGRVVEDEQEFGRLTQCHIDKYNRLSNIAWGTQDVEYIRLDEHGRDNMGVPLFDFSVRCVIEVSPKVRFW